MLRPSERISQHTVNADELYTKALPRYHADSE